MIFKPFPPSFPFHNIRYLGLLGGQLFRLLGYRLIAALAAAPALAYR